MEKQPMKKMSVNEMVDEINALRAAAGLDPKRYWGSRRGAIQHVLTMARRGEMA